MSEEELAGRDLAEMNLACAAGLPDATDIDVQGCLKRLDEMAEYVRRFTARMWPAFERRPEEFNRSPGYFRMLCMITALQRDLGVRYNPAKIPKEVPLDTADIFIHGVLLGAGGTCSSLPVVYANVCYANTLAALRRWAARNRTECCRRPIGHPPAGG
jgi:hypothetical protein